MAVSAGNSIQEDDYNAIVTTINTVMGQGTGNTGYGQNTGLVHVAAGANVTAAQVEALRTQINLAVNHQTGSNSSVPQFYSGNIIGADASNTGTDNTVTRSSTDTFSIDNPDTNKGFNDLETAANGASTDRDSHGGTSLSTTTVYNYGTADLSFTSNWQRLQAVVRADFAGGYDASNANGTTTTTSVADHIRHFFNAGGSLSINARVENNSGAKSNDWNTIIEAVSNVIVSADEVTSSSGTTSLSQRELTTTYQEIMTKSGSSGVYAENEYHIDARLNGNGLQFRIRFDDNDTGDQTGSGGPVDESVNGDVQIRIRTIAPTSGIIVAAPTWSVDTALGTY